jgi:GNAT superfamily N-acetyltransferase
MDTRAGPQVRPMADDDDLDALSAGYVFGWLTQSWFEMAAASTDLELHAFTALLGGEPVGYAVCSPQPFARDGHCVGAVHVLPEHRRQGVGSALRAAVHDVVRGRAPGIQWQHDADDPDAIATAAAWGLTPVGEHRESYLDLTSLDRARFEELARAEGTDLVPLRDLDDPGWLQLWEFFTERQTDAPDADEDTESIPLDVFRAMVDEPWMLLTAEEEGRRLGLTYVVRRPGTDRTCNTWFTGVSPEARGRGLATALKARQAILMADAGVERLFTQNMEGNDAILRANATLGFEPGLRYVDVTEPLG